MRIAVCFLLFSSIIRYIRTKNTKKNFESNCSPRASLSGVGAPAALGSFRKYAMQGREVNKGVASARVIMYARGKNVKKTENFWFWVNFLPKLFGRNKENT